MDLITTIASGLLIGLLGSFHCVGMCGPLAMTLPVTSLGGKIKLSRVILYNLGRAITYATLGFLLGLIGNSFSLFGWQRVLTILCGVLMLLFVLFKYTNLSHTAFASKINTMVQKNISKYLYRNQTPSSLFIIGLLNGLLPCGLVYIALSSALATGNALNGSLIMFFFGLGTIPAMATVMIFHKLISLNFRKRINYVTPYIISLIAILLIIRGLNLGIPYLSPKMETTQVHVVKCH